MSNNDSKGALQNPSSITEISSVSVNVTVLPDNTQGVIKRKGVEPIDCNVQFKSEVSYQTMNDGSECSKLKNILALLMIIIVPNLVMILTFTVLHCQSSYISLFKYISSHSLGDSFDTIWLIGDYDLIFGFLVIVGYMIFAVILMVLVPGNVVFGPLTPNGNKPKYVDNGFRCYVLSVLAFVVLTYILSNYTAYSVSILHTKLPSLFYCLNAFSLIFCLLLYFKGIYFPSSSDCGSTGFLFFDYYWGTELHPRIFGVDLKIFTNCRCGMTAWALLIISYLVHSFESKQIHGGQVVNAILQLLYITKFFWWEAGYYSTIDIMLDRAGFYICWGCLSFVPSMYTLSAFYMANVRVDNYTGYYIFIFIIGSFSLIINYWADYQKQVFRLTNGTCTIWGKPPVILEAFYVDHNGCAQKSIFLVSGFWGLARHFHYFPELMLAFCWCSAAGFNHLLPFTYFIFLTILLIHRVERDDKKCLAKYGAYYAQYKNMVRWKIIPYIY